MDFSPAASTPAIPSVAEPDAHADGTRPTRVLVLLHAFPVGVDVWHPQLHAFPEWRVIVPPLPGFDGSDPIDEPSIDAYAARVVHDLASAGVTKAVIAGLSLGGYVALAIHRTHPALVAGLILADTRSTADSADALKARRHMLEMLDTGGPSAIADDVLPKLLGATTRREHPEVVARCRERIVQQPAAAIAGAVRAMMTRPDATPGLAHIDVPTLVIVGDEDTITPPAEAEALQSGIRGARLARIPRAGHLSSLENPAAFNAAVSEFLDTTS